MPFICFLSLLNANKWRYTVAERALMSLL